MCPRFASTLRLSRINRAPSRTFTSTEPTLRRLGNICSTNIVVNMSHSDLMRPDFIAMTNEGIVGVIHEATFPQLERDARYYERQRAALDAGLFWGAYHYGDATNPIGQADHFINAIASA